MAATTPPKKKTIADVLKKAKPAQRSVEICVDGSVSAEHEELVAELEGLAVANPGAIDPRLSGPRDPAAVALAERVTALEAEMAEATVTFRFRALAAKPWSDLLAKHPDPKRERLFNPDTFVPAAIAACCIDPEGFDDAEQVAALFDALSAGQQTDLFEAAWEVNQSGPKGQTSLLASALLQPSVTSSPTA